MESNRLEGESHHEITIWEVNKDRLDSIAKKIAEPPRLLSRVAGKSSCSIFRVPQPLVEVNGKSYEPHIVSIGPFHRRRPHLQMIEEHKWRYLGSVLSRTQQHKGFTLEHYLRAVELLESRARECYSEEIKMEKDEFVEMMVVDGCFIIELFRKVAMMVATESDDPIFTMAWILPFFYRDLLRLENQIPYFVLECLFDLSRMPGEESGPTLSFLALRFFNNALQRPDDVVSRYKDLRGYHLLDLVRSSFIPSDQYKQRDLTITTPTHMIHCVSKLRRAGIKLNQSQQDSFLIVEFSHGILYMPTITIDEIMITFLQNCVAFEQCHKSYSKHMTTYAMLLDFLVNTYKDVEYLCDRNIIENYYFGTDGEVAQFLNKLGKDVAFDIDQCYLAEVFNDVHQYYRNILHVQWASFKYTYFDTPWSFISALAAFVLLILTLAQTYFTMISYIRPRN